MPYGIVDIHTDYNNIKGAHRTGFIILIHEKHNVIENFVTH